MLVSVVDDGQSARKSASTDVDDLEISIDENVASVVNDKTSLVVVDNINNQKERAAVGFEQKEMPLNERDVDTKLREDESKPSIQESNSESKGNKKKKKASMGTESIQSNNRYMEAKKEEQSSSKGI